MSIERYVTREDAFNESARLDSISRLRRELSLPTVNLEARNQTPLAIGIEIEMTWRHVFPEIAEEWPNPRELDISSDEYQRFSKAYDARDTQLKPTLQHIQRVIPRVGLDAYWEFSFLPTHNVAITAAEIDILYELGVLTDEHEYALHMTVAGINNDPDAFAFLCGLEQVGGTSADRIIEAASSAKGAWARKGNGGIMKRRADELIGEDQVGYEFRTLSAQSQGQVTHMLNKAADFSRLLHDDNDSWKVYRRDTEQLLKNHGLELKAWPRPKDDPVHWLRYIELLDSVKLDY